MFEDKKILAIIPARGGSKGIPHKNIIKLSGKPLISYTIQAALVSKYTDYVMVSTDDDDIAMVSKEFGAEVPFMRPTELASDTAKTIDVIVHAINELDIRGDKFDIIILLQPTAPLRTSDDIDRAIETFYKHDCNPLVSVSEVDDHPILIRSIEGNQLRPLLDISSTCRRQDMPNYYRVNGCIYINMIKDITKNTSLNDNGIPFIMQRSHSVDIDDLSDIALAEYYIKENI